MQGVFAGGAAHLGAGRQTAAYRRAFWLAKQAAAQRTVQVWAGYARWFAVWQARHGAADGRRNAAGGTAGAAGKGGCHAWLMCGWWPFWAGAAIVSRETLRSSRSGGGVLQHHLVPFHDLAEGGAGGGPVQHIHAPRQVGFRESIRQCRAHRQGQWPLGDDGQIQVGIRFGAPSGA